VNVPAAELGAPRSPTGHAPPIEDQHLLGSGHDVLYIQQIGPDQEGFLEFFENEVRPRL